MDIRRTYSDAGIPYFGRINMLTRANIILALLYGMALWPRLRSGPILLKVIISLNIEWTGGYCSSRRILANFDIVPSFALDTSRLHCNRYMGDNCSYRSKQSFVIKLKKLFTQSTLKISKVQKHVSARRMCAKMIGRELSQQKGQQV